METKKLVGETIICAALMMTLLFSQILLANEGAVVELRSTVTGNQEQPKVLYLVPWQQADGPDSLYRPLNSLVSEVFQPMERREFIREIRFREMLFEASVKD